jgi:ATP-binding protein involved in chromosome partitioning
MIDRNELGRLVEAALQGVKVPGTDADVLSSERVRDLEVASDGVVRMVFQLAPADPGSLVKEVRSALEGIEGVAKVKIDVKLPQAEGAGASARGGHGHAHPHGSVGHQGLRPGSVPAPTPQASLREKMRHVVAVSSGKGGVGKSTVAANLAAALASEGQVVGLLDADIYGPDIPLMFGTRERPKVTGERGAEKIVPLEAHGVKLMSLGFLLDEEQPAIMRGPLIAGILKQFLEQVEWGELDWLIVDMPPGTGDAQLSLVQTITLDGALMVTTPQDVATGDVRRAIRMFERVNTRILGVVENMAGYECPGCGHHAHIFGEGGGKRLAEDMQVPLLGEVPLDIDVRVAGDAGSPTAVSSPASAAGRAFRDVAQRLMAELDAPVGAA